MLYHGDMDDALVDVKGIALGGNQTASISAVINMLLIETVSKLDEPEKHLWKGKHLVDIAPRSSM